MTDMNKEQLFKKFEELFPNWAKKAFSYKKIGSKTLAINFVTSVEGNKVNEESKVFMYYNPNNWQFGTKIWRKRPDKKTGQKSVNLSKEDQIKLRNVLLPYIEDIPTTENCLGELLDNFEIKKK